LIRGYNSYETEQGKSVEVSYDIPRAELTIPVSRVLATTISFSQELNQNYEYTRPLEAEGRTIGTSRVRRQGSLYTFSLGLAGRLGEEWYVGGAVGYDFGAPKEIFTKEFKEKGYSKVEENLEAAYKGVRGTVGAGYMLSDRLSVGATAEVFSRHRVEETIFTEYATLYENEYDFTMPWSAGAGAAYIIGPRGRLAADVRYTGWSGFAVDGEGRGYRDTLEFHAGVEGRISSANRGFFLWRMPYRAGAFYVPWYATDRGELSKVGFSVGAGYLFANNENSRLDFALEVGRRGDLASAGIQEQTLDFYISVVGLETWFGKREED
jgi:hypothetical protein